MGKGENNEGEDISNTKTSSVVLISTYKKVSFAFRITMARYLLVVRKGPEAEETHCFTAGELSRQT